MTFSIGICEDSIEDQKMIESLLLKYQFSNNVDFNRTNYTSASEMLKEYHKGRFNILILDVELPDIDINGIELAKKIRNLPDEDVYILFTSNYPKYIINGYDVKAFHFLQKPVQQDQLFEILNKIINEHHKKASKMLIHIDRDQEIVININDIIYVESIGERNHSAFHLINKVVIGIMQFKGITDKLKDYNFHLANRTTLINPEHISGFVGNMVILDNEDKISMSRMNKEKLHSQFSDTVLSLQ